MATSEMMSYPAGHTGRHTHTSPSRSACGTAAVCVSRYKSRVLAGFLAAGIFALNGCGESLTKQTVDGSKPSTEPPTSAKETTTPGTDATDDSSLRAFMLPGEQAWVFQTSAVNESTYSIHVTDSSGKEVQVIRDIAARPPLTTKELLEMNDYNADGYIDIRASTLPVGGSAITGSMLYIFDPSSRKFFESKGIDQEGEIVIEPDGCISVEYRSDAMNYSKDHYCWKENEWEFQRTTKD